MESKKFAEEQIIGLLKEAEAGTKTVDLAGRHLASEATIYNWKAKCDGLEVYEARRGRELESENAKLKRLLAQTMPDNIGLKDLLSKNVSHVLSKQGSNGVNGASLHKCIQPLASGPLLRPGLDAIHAPRSKINASGSSARSMT